jgi:hypothetical protein
MHMSSENLIMFHCIIQGAVCLSVHMHQHWMDFHEI